jgi:glutathione S-transferase
VKLDMTGYSHIEAWMKHVTARPSVAAALAAEGF